MKFVFSFGSKTFESTSGKNSAIIIGFWQKRYFIFDWSDWHTPVALLDIFKPLYESIRVIQQDNDRGLQFVVTGSLLCPTEK